MDFPTQKNSINLLMNCEEVRKMLNGRVVSNKKKLFKYAANLDFLTQKNSSNLLMSEDVGKMLNGTKELPTTHYPLPTTH